ncbi:hypothetical protein PPACK8108_LOCUS9039, partial [Phakopsora pachyrhizi]
LFLFSLDLFTFFILFLLKLFPIYCNRIYFHNSIGQGICNTDQAMETFWLMQPTKGFSYTLTQYRSMHIELYADLQLKCFHQ